jgi:hypothetical protein
MARYEVPCGGSKIGFDLPPGSELPKPASPRPAPKVANEEKEIKSAIEQTRKAPPLEKWYRNRGI